MFAVPNTQVLGQLESNLLGTLWTFVFAWACLLGSVWLYTYPGRKRKRAEKTAAVEAMVEVGRPWGGPHRHPTGPAASLAAINGLALGRSPSSNDVADMATINGTNERWRRRSLSFTSINTTETQDDGKVPFVKDVDIPLGCPAPPFASGKCIRTRSKIMQVSLMFSCVLCRAYWRDRRCFRAL